jgi:hypothetical protein
LRKTHDNLKIKGSQLIACDLMDAAATRKTLTKAKTATHIFFATWARQKAETGNCRVYGPMLRPALEGAVAVVPAPSSTSFSARCSCARHATITGK